MTRVPLLLLMVCTVPLSAVDLPNFTGTWKLNVAESSFAKEYAQSRLSISLEIVHEEPSISIQMVTSAGSYGIMSEGSYKVTTDGKPGTLTTRNVMPGAFGKKSDKLSEGVIEASWDQRDLVLLYHDPKNSSKTIIKLDPTTGQLVWNSNAGFGKRTISIKMIYDKVPK